MHFRTAILFSEITIFLLKFQYCNEEYLEVLSQAQQFWSINMLFLRFDEANLGFLIQIVKLFSKWREDYVIEVNFSLFFNRFIEISALKYYYLVIFK